MIPENAGTSVARRSVTHARARAVPVGRLERKWDLGASAALGGGSLRALSRERADPGRRCYGYGRPARGGAARPCARRVKPPGIITDLGRTAATSTLEKSSHTKSNPKI